MGDATPAASKQQRTNDGDSVYRVTVQQEGGPRDGLPLATGFESERSFDDEADAEALAEDIRENPEEYYPQASDDPLADGIRVEVFDDTRSLPEH